MQFAGATVVVNRGVEIVGGGVTDTQPVHNRGINFAWPGFRVKQWVQDYNIYIPSLIVAMRINIPKSTLRLLMFSLQEVAQYVPVKEATGPKRLAIYCKTLMVSLESL